MVLSVGMFRANPGKQTPIIGQCASMENLPGCRIFLIVHAVLSECVWRNFEVAGSSFPLQLTCNLSLAIDNVLSLSYLSLEIWLM